MILAGLALFGVVIALLWARPLFGQWPRQEQAPPLELPRERSPRLGPEA